MCCCFCFTAHNIFLGWLLFIFSSYYFITNLTILCLGACFFTFLVFVFVEHCGYVFKVFIKFGMCSVTISSKIFYYPLGGSDGKESACKAGDPVSILGSGRSPEGKGNPLQYSCLENSVDRGTWWAVKSVGSQRVRHNWATNILQTPVIDILVCMLLFYSWLVICTLKNILFSDFHFRSLLFLWFQVHYLFVFSNVFFISYFVVFIVIRLIWFFFLKNAFCVSA